MQALELERYGLRWSYAEHVLAHPLPDGHAAVLSRDVARTAAGLEQLGRGDGAAWRRLHVLWESLGPHLLDALFVPFPPVRSGMALAARLRAPGLLRFARFALLLVRRLIEEEFTGPGSLLLAGSALHADLMPESAGSSMYGWLLAMLGHQYGWPVPEGGAGELAAALVRRLSGRGGMSAAGTGCGRSSFATGERLRCVPDPEWRSRRASLRWQRRDGARAPPPEVRAVLLSARLADAPAADCDIAVVTTLPDPSLSRTCSARASTCFYSRHFGEASLSPQGPALACRDAKLFMRQAGLFGLAGGEVCYPRAGHPG
jgi:hypothetical protein